MKLSVKDVNTPYKSKITVYPNQNSKLAPINNTECHSSVNLQDRQAVLDVLKGRQNRREGLRRDLYGTESDVLHATSIN